MNVQTNQGEYIMAKSKARKHREHLVRNGRLDPAVKRGAQPDFSTHERKLPSKLGKRSKQENKHKSWKRYED